MKEVGHKGFNKMWGKVLIKMCSNAIWKVIAATNLSRSLEELLSRLDKIEDGDIFASLKLTTEAPVNIQDPVLFMRIINGYHWTI